MRHLALATAITLLAVGVCSATTYLVSNTNDSGGGSLRQAIVMANSHAGADIIHFTVPEGSVIRPLTPLPAVTQQTAIDTQPGTDGKPHVGIYAQRSAARLGLAW